MTTWQARLETRPAKLIPASGCKIPRLAGLNKSLNSNLNFGNANREGRPGDNRILYKSPPLPSIHISSTLTDPEAQQILFSILSSRLFLLDSTAK
jgi:hypothetical protein